MLTNAYVDGDRLVLVERKNGKRLIRSATAEWVAYLRAAKVSIGIERGLSSSMAVRSVKREGEWLRVGFLGPEARRAATGRDGFFAHHGLEHFEGDVDPAKLEAAVEAASGVPTDVGYTDWPSPPLRIPSRAQDAPDAAFVASGPYFRTIE